MKLLRYGPLGQEKPGLLDDRGNIRDLSAVLNDIDGEALAPERLRSLRELDQSQLPIVAGSPRYGCPVANVGKFIAVGLNYSDHAAESNLPIPSEPILFSKAVSCIQGPNDDIVIPADQKKQTGRLSSASLSAPEQATCTRRMLSRA